MSYNNDEQARRAQAAQNAQRASNRSQPQNTYPYQTGTFSNPDEPIIHTVEEPSMNLLNSPSSHSIPGLPHNPAPLPMRYQNPARQQDLPRTTLVNQTYNQGQSSRGPPNVDYSAQPPSYYGQAPPNSRTGPSGSQAAQRHRLGSMSNPIVYEGPSANEVEQRERRRKDEEERKAHGICPQASCRNLVVPGKAKCEEHLEANRQRRGAYREKKRAAGKCYQSGCDEPAVAAGERCQKCIDASRAYRQARK